MTRARKPRTTEDRFTHTLTVTIWCPYPGHHKLAAFGPGVEHTAPAPLLTLACPCGLSYVTSDHLKQMAATARLTLKPQVVGSTANP